MTTALTHRPQCRSRTISSGSWRTEATSGAIDRGFLQRALLDTPALQNLGIRSVGDQFTEGLVHRVAKGDVVLREPDAVGSALDRLTGYDLEDVAVTGGARDVRGAG